MPVIHCSTSEVLPITPISLSLLAASQPLRLLALVACSNGVLQKGSTEVAGTQPAGHRLATADLAADMGLQEVSTDPEKLGPRAADVGGKKMLQLLNDVSGAFRPGILTALVGSSGAGKTTLMDVLAGRKTSESPCSCNGGHRCGEGWTGKSRAGGWLPDYSMLTSMCLGQQD